MRRRKNEGLDCILLLAAIAFCMFAGAATYHQYLKMQEKEPVATSQPEEQETEPMVPIQQSIYNITAETAYFVADPAGIGAEIYEDDIELMAACVEAEAGNQGLTGKRLVADVILNRVDAEGFPDTIEGVITQPRHFSSYWSGAMSKAEPTEETYRAVRMEMEKRSYPGLLYFDSGDYLPYGTPWKKVGDHYFSTR